MKALDDYRYKSYYYNSNVNKNGNKYTSELEYELNSAGQPFMYNEHANAYIKVNENVLIKIKSVGPDSRTGELLAVVLQYVWSRDGNIYMRTVVVPYKALLDVIKPPYIPLLTDFN